MGRNETGAMAAVRVERRSGAWGRKFLFACLAVGAVHVLTAGTQTQGASCLVTTVSGDVQGLDNGSSCTFLGIPFAAPPIDNLRWKPPQPAAAWAPATFARDRATPCVPKRQPGWQHFDGGERELPETEHLDTRPRTCFTGAGHRLDPYRRIPGG